MDPTINTLPQRVNIDNGLEMLKQNELLKKQVKRTANFDNKGLNWKKGKNIKSVDPVLKDPNDAFGVLSQEDYVNAGYSNSIPLNNTFKLLFNGDVWSKELETIQALGDGDGGYNIRKTIEHFGIWFLFYFSVFSESIILLKMIFYTLFAWFYKNSNSENKDNKNMKLYSKLLVTLLIFNLIILPIIMTLFFNTKYGLLK
jgi:hypothetical protein